MLKLILSVCLFTSSFHVVAQTTDASTSQSVQNAFQNLTATGNYSGASLPIFGHKEDTKGSRYLFEHWVNGYAVNNKNITINVVGYAFNYDKINSSLLVTTDKRSCIEVANADLNSFVLTDDERSYSFVHLPFINPKVFFIEIEKDAAKYALYKLIKTKFIKSNYHNDGLTESGNNYDEYADETEYYIVFPGGTSFKKIELKKKSIKEVFAAENAKVDSYFSQHKNDDFTENYLKGLVQFLNK